MSKWKRIKCCDCFLQKNSSDTYATDVGDTSNIPQDIVVTGAVVPITGSLIKSPNPYPCTDCQLVFSTKKALSRHLAKHDKGGDISGLLDAVDKAEFPAESAELPTENVALPAENTEIAPEGADILGSFGLDTPQQPDGDNETSDSSLKMMFNLPKPSPAKTNQSSSSSSLRVTCQVCGTQTLKQHMARHMLSHTGVKPYACDQCDCAYARKDKLKEHMRKHEPGSDLVKRSKRGPKSKMNKCRKCDYQTEDKELFKEHRKTHPAKMVYK